MPHQSRNRPPVEWRVLILAPTARDASLGTDVLAGAGFTAEACPSAEALASEIQNGAGAVLFTEDAISGAMFRTLAAMIRRQPAWSDLPMILLARGGADSPAANLAIEMLGNVIPLDRPVRIATLLTTLRTAILGRERQYQVRDYLLENLRQAERLEEARSVAEGARRVAEQASEAKDRFLAILSHELRNPLTPVMTGIDILERDLSIRNELREVLRLMRRNLELETRLIDDMLDLTRIARGKLRISRSLTDAAEVLRHAAEKCEGEARRKSIAFEWKLEAQHTRLWADPGRLEQVFWNLLSNAVRFTPAGGTIVLRTVNATADGHSRLIVEVEDNGVGMTPEVQNRIFRPFEQGPDARPAGIGGLGLGLSISKALVEMHGGLLSARSDGPGQGSVFSVAIGGLSRADSRRLVPGVSTPTEQVRPFRILLVEDHRDSADALGRLLEASGHVVTTARDMKTALEAASGATFDLLVSDIGLPDGSGVELLRRLRARGPVRGIALSGYGMDTDLQRSREAGFSAHLVKPVAADQLLEAIRIAARVPVAATSENHADQDGS